MLGRTADMSVLVVDDGENARKLMSMVLKGIGFRRVVAVDGAAPALEALHERDGADFALVICDWQMPGMSGMELLERVRDLLPEMPFLMVTGRNDEISAEAARAGGVDGFLVKPFTPPQVRSIIEQILSRVAD